MQTNYNYYTWIVIGIFLVIAMACYFYDKGEYANDKSKTKDINKGWDLTGEDFNCN